MSEKQNQCHKKIRHNFQSYLCKKKAKVERNGVWYCGIHDPVRIEEKRKERNAKQSAIWNERDAKVKAREKRERAAADLIDCVLSLKYSTLEYSSAMVSQKDIDELLQLARMAKKPQGDMT